TYHDGGFVGWPRYHTGGLASDEVAAVLQTGEYVASRAEVSAALTSPKVTNHYHVTVTPPSDGSSYDRKSAEAWGRTVASTLKAEIIATIDDQMRPGGRFNRGVKV
ncbi:MAG: hypothetical protein LLG06_02135, partial [Desulfobacteraceae bacterium]|nr:hypothetical protein [Desulfobacteraceae bacterium]